MQSVSKSVTSALVGIAIGRGEMPGVQIKVAPSSSWASSSDRDKWVRLTLEHVLTMTTGITWDECSVTYTDPANSAADMEKSEDWIQFVLDQPMAPVPGPASSITAAPPSCCRI